MLGAKLLVRNGLMQNNLDANHFQIENLDTSNLGLATIPPSIIPPAHYFLRSWDAASEEWGIAQPAFTDIFGVLTGFQQQGIYQVGRVIRGTWFADPIDKDHVPRLNLLNPPLAALSMNNQRISNLADPVDLQDAVTRKFMDDLLQGLIVHEAVRCATTTRVVLSTFRNPVDGVTLVEGDRVLVKNQGAGVEAKNNGIWIAHAGSWTKALDADSGSELDRAYMFVLEGTQNGGTSWVQPLSGLTVGTSEFNFLLFSVSTAPVPGDGLELDGNTLNVLGTADRILVGTAVDIDPGYVGQTSITTLGTVTTGFWQSNIIGSEFGGTGADNGGHTLNLATDMSVGLTLDAIGANLQLNVRGATNLLLPQSGELATLAGVETWTNKRITPRIVKTPTAAQPDINTDLLDGFYITALGTAILSMTDKLSGTPNEGDRFFIWIKDNGIIARTINWGDAWAASTDMPLPVLTKIGKWLFCDFQWLSEKSQWVLTTKVENII